jgi:hypothetical protein
LLVWLGVQAAALMLAAFRVPLAAQYPQPGEFQAVRVMLAAQFFALAILFPWMMRTWASALAVLATTWVMLCAAAALSAWTLLDIMPAGTLVTAWIIVFATLGQIRSRRWQLVASAVTCAYIIGGPFMWYLQVEFASASPGSSGFAFGPVFGLISTPRHVPPPDWGLALAGECVALVGVWIARKDLKHGI